MNHQLMRQLSEITEEERRILDGGELDMSLYSDQMPSVVDSNKLLSAGKLFTIRPATRFIDFPRHSHNYVEMIYMCSGTQRHLIGDNTEIILKKGEILLLNQHASHQTSAAGFGDIAINLIVLPQFFNTAIEMIGSDNKISQFLFSGLTGHGHEIPYMLFNVADVLPVQNLMENLIWSVVNKQPNRRNINQITMGLLFLQLLGCTDRLITAEAATMADTMVMTALREIEENYATASLNSVAERCHVSPAYVSSTVKSVTGKTFKEHLMEKRLTKSAILLKNTSLSVSDIIVMVGYENTSYFYRIFTEKYGVSPKTYRKQVQHAEIK
ncbi:MAG: helix-turn-helix domain-containing protein [Clostridia bacterium]|nr:helix-turn-helix domain-containing protein [Clostridia bacterium]